MVRASTYEKVQAEIKKLEGKPLDSIVDNLNKILAMLVEQSEGSFSRKAHGLVMEGSGWDQKVVMHERDLKVHLK